MHWAKVLMSCAAASLLALNAQAAMATKAVPQPMDHTYVKLFQAVPNGAWDDVSDERLKEIAKNYYWINSHAGSWLKGSAPESRPNAESMKRAKDGDADWAYFAGPSAKTNVNGKTVGERLRKLNPQIILTNYRNGAYTNQNAVREAGEIEKQIPLSIAVWDTHTSLTQPLARQDKVVYLNPPSKVPPDMPAIYPFKASTTRDKYTQNKKAYVGWLRLGDEILRIDKAEAEDGKIKLSVQRGYWGTKANTHETDTVVLAPVYCGSGRAGNEYGLSGLPDGTSAQRGLRYVMNQSRKEFWRFLAEKSEECMNEGYNGPWYDCTSSPWINHSNAYAVSLKMTGAWDPELKRNVDHETYREYQQRKLDYMFEHYPRHQFYVNWFFPQFYFENGTDRLLFSGENGHHPISGGAIEMYANPGNMQWLPLMKMQLDMTKEGFRHISWVKARDMGPKYQMYAYGTHLMVHENGAEQYWGREGDPFQPSAFLFYDLGEPVQHFEAIEQAELKDVPGVYARDFTKAKVLVNPQAKEEKTVRLDEELYDVMKKEWVKKVTLEPQSAALLLKPAEGEQKAAAPASEAKEEENKPDAQQKHNEDLERVLAE